MDDFNVDVEELDNAIQKFNNTIKEIKETKESLKKFSSEMESIWQDKQFEKYKTEFSGIDTSLETSVNEMNENIKALKNYQTTMSNYLNS